MKTARLENKKNLVTKVYRCNYLVEMHSMNSMMASFLKRQSSFSNTLSRFCAILIREYQNISMRIC